MTPQRRQERLQFQIFDAGLSPAQDKDRKAHLSFSNLPLKEYHPGVALCGGGEQPLFRLAKDAMFDASTMCGECQAEARHDWSLDG